MKNDPLRTKIDKLARKHVASKEVYDELMDYIDAVRNIDKSLKERVNDYLKVIARNNKDLYEAEKSICALREKNQKIEAENKALRQRLYDQIKGERE